MKHTAMLTESVFNFQKFEEDLHARLALRMHTMQYVSESVLFRGHTYLSTSLSRKKIPQNVVVALCKEYGLQLRDYELRTSKQLSFDQNPSGWDSVVNVNLNAGVVYVGIFRDGEKIASGRSKIFDQTDRGIIQAISYASHMCYKIAEQRELAEKESA